MPIFSGMDMMKRSDLYSVSELARDLGVTPRTLRFYEDKGLLEPRRIGTTRVYSHRDRGRLALILRGKRLGFSLREIREWLDLYEADPGQVKQMRVLIGKVGERIAALEQQRRDIDATITELQDMMIAAERHLAGRTSKRSIS